MRHILKKSNVVSVIILMVIISIFTRCQKENAYNSTVIDVPFLSFNTNVNGKTVKLHEEDIGVLVSAFQRIRITEKEGMYQMLETSANQINVSKDVFSCLNEMIKKSNKRILEYNQRASLIPRLKSGPENGGSTSNDCVAESVVNIAGALGTSLSLSSVKKWIEEKYGTNGVPSGSMTEVVANYFSYSSVSITHDYTPPKGTRVLVIFNFGNGTGHASTYLACSGHYVLCVDGYYSLNQVSSAYLISGVN